MSKQEVQFFHFGGVIFLCLETGAGKSTCLGVLTGMIMPSDGDCLIGGRSIVREPRAMHHSLGYCPQDSVLFDKLTVSEHIRFFTGIKGMMVSNEDIRRRTQEVGLTEFYATSAESLSGGNQRKLSLAIAFCGDPQLLVLDEPTSGMGEYVS